MAHWGLLSLLKKKSCVWKSEIEMMMMMMVMTTIIF